MFPLNHKFGKKVKLFLRPVWLWFSCLIIKRVPFPVFGLLVLSSPSFGHLVIIMFSRFSFLAIQIISLFYFLGFLKKSFDSLCVAISNVSGTCFTISLIKTTAFIYLHTDVLSLFSCVSSKYIYKIICEYDCILHYKSETCIRLEL